MHPAVVEPVAVFFRDLSRGRPGGVDGAFVWSRVIDDADGLVDRGGRRRALLLDRIATIPRFTAHGVPAGLHTLITTPGSTDHGPTEQHLLDHCAAHGIALRGLTELHHDPADSPPGLPIGFAVPSERAYPAALNALTSALRDHVGVTPVH